MTGRTRFPLWLGGALALLFLLNAAAAIALLRPPQFTVVIDPSQMRSESGLAWIVPVPLGNVVFQVEGDRTSRPRSNLRLFENQTELKPGGSLHADIREQGSGRFSHWRQSLYFSTTDGSDPRKNGRTYSVSVAGGLNTYLLLALALLDFLCFAALRPILIRRYGQSAERVRSPDFMPTLSPLKLAALVVATAFVLAWFCGFTHRTNDDSLMRMIAEGAMSGSPSEFLIYENVIAGLVLRSLYNVAPRVPWYDLVLAAGSMAGALLLLTAVVRLNRSHRGMFFCALVGLIVFTGIFQNLQFSAAAIVLAGGATALLVSVAFRPPASSHRLQLSAAVAAAAFFWGSLFRFEAAFLSAALVAPMLMLWTRQGIAALRVPLLGLAAGIVLAASGKAFDVSYYRFTPGWEHFQAEKRQRLRVTEYLHADPSRVGEMDAALSTVGWSHNDYDLLIRWMFALPDLFSIDRIARFAELAPRQPWAERIANFVQVMSHHQDTLWIFIAICGLVLIVTRSFYAVGVMLVSAFWWSAAMIALSIVYKPNVTHFLWVTCGMVSLVAVGTAFAGAGDVRRRGYRLVEDRVVAAGVFAAIGYIALWQTGDAWARMRTDNELRARLVREVAAWPITSNTKLLSWNADFPFETWIRPFQPLSPHERQFFRTTHNAVSPLADPVYAAWGTKDVLWALCHDPQTYLVAGRRGYVARQKIMLSKYMHEHHKEDVALVPVFEGDATSLFACRPAGTKG
ncbi:MAG: hypothetical protein K2Y71_06545 [Xanthobacteraceae bacterium]|nr:hypothetical protein [Xanthobacteraceae bacterium]